MGCETMINAYITYSLILAEASEGCVVLKAKIHENCCLHSWCGYIVKIESRGLLSTERED